jgi:hypothetical protein
VRQDASDTVKQAIAKIFYAKREFMAEVSKHQFQSDRLERLEAEIAYLKDDMVTHA